MHIPQREELLAKLIDCLKPGGTLFLEESDANPVRTLDHTGWHDLTVRVFDLISARGSHVEWGRELPYKMSALGLENVRAEAAFSYFHGGSEQAEFWKISWGRVRDGVAETGADVTQWDCELAELDDPSRLFVGPMTVSVIATKPAQSS